MSIQKDSKGREGASEKKISGLGKDKVIENQDQKKSVRISVYLKPDLAARLEDFKLKYSQKSNSVLNRALVEFLDREGF